MSAKINNKVTSTLTNILRTAKNEFIKAMITDILKKKYKLSEEEIKKCLEDEGSFIKGKVSLSLEGIRNFANVKTVNDVKTMVDDLLSKSFKAFSIFFKVGLFSKLFMFAGLKDSCLKEHNINKDELKNDIKEFFESNRLNELTQRILKNTEPKVEKFAKELLESEEMKKELEEAFKIKKREIIKGKLKAIVAEIALVLILALILAKMLNIGVFDILMLKISVIKTALAQASLITKALFLIFVFLLLIGVVKIGLDIKDIIKVAFMKLKKTK